MLKVLITGGTGSIGRALVEICNPDMSFTIFSRDEVKQSVMRAKYPYCKYVLGDIRDYDALEMAFRGHDVVIHAAAYKQVPTAEVNTNEAVKTNIFGSVNVANAAVRAGVDRVIGISTDKACSPINLYGKTKAVMEAVFQNANDWSDTQFNLTRYGNVIGSTGSIIPLFQQQAAQGGPLTVTDYDMNRFWLTLGYAVELILTALREPVGGTIVVPKLPSMKVVDVAQAIAHDLPIEKIGIRPGEKIDEALVNAGEALHTTDNGEFFRIFPASVELDEYQALGTGFEYRTDNNGWELSISDFKEMLCPEKF